MDDRFETMAARRWDVRDRLFSLFLVRCDKSAAWDHAPECVNVHYTSFASLIPHNSLDGVL